MPLHLLVYIIIQSCSYGYDRGACYGPPCWRAIACAANRERCPSSAAMISHAFAASSVNWRLNHLGKRVAI
jgi:hypothetical protein